MKQCWIPLKAGAEYKYGTCKYYEGMCEENDAAKNAGVLFEKPNTKLIVSSLEVAKCEYNDVVKQCKMALKAIKKRSLDHNSSVVRDNISCVIKRESVKNKNEDEIRLITRQLECDLQTLHNNPLVVAYLSKSSLWWEHPWVIATVPVIISAVFVALILLLYGIGG